MTDLAIHRYASFSKCGTWRYSLQRHWDSELPKATFVMLNPSVANAHQDDPTTTQCLKRVVKAGYGRYEAVNLFALVSTDPQALRSYPDPVGPDNDEYIRAAADKADMIVVAWGNLGYLQGRADHVLNDVLRSRELWCLGQNRNGTPRFPLRVSYAQGFVPYR